MTVAQHETGNILPGCEHYAGLSGHVRAFDEVLRVDPNGNRFRLTTTGGQGT